MRYADCVRDTRPMVIQLRLKYVRSVRSVVRRRARDAVAARPQKPLNARHPHTARTADRTRCAHAGLSRRPFRDRPRNFLIIYYKQCNHRAHQESERPQGRRATLARSHLLLVFIVHKSYRDLCYTMHGWCIRTIEGSRTHTVTCVMHI